MESKDHPVTLTTREQQALAGLERATSQSDPHLDAWLRTGRRTHRIRWSATRQVVVAAVTLTVATGLMLFTFTRWWWLAGLTAVLQAAALGSALRGLSRLRRDRSG